MRTPIIAALAAATLASGAAAAPPPWAPANGYRAQDARYVGQDQYGRPIYVADRDDRQERREYRRERREYRDARDDQRDYQRGYRDAQRQQRHFEGYAPYDRYGANPNRYWDGNRYNGRMYEQRVANNGVRYWRGDDGRYYCRRSNGTTGLIVGALAGGTLGNVIAGRGDKTLGSIIGGGLGAVLGSSIDKGQVRCN